MPDRVVFTVRLPVSCLTLTRALVDVAAEHPGDLAVRSGTEPGTLDVVLRDPREGVLLRRETFAMSPDLVVHVARSVSTRMGRGMRPGFLALCGAEWVAKGDDETAGRGHPVRPSCQVCRDMLGARS